MIDFPKRSIAKDGQGNGDVRLSHWKLYEQSWDKKRNADYTGINKGRNPS